MKRTIITTGDGSKTIQIEEWNEQYHSKHGAIQEAYHVFIQNGLALFDNTDLRILEIGFGTGLNALITYLEAPKRNIEVEYVGVEAYPVIPEEWRQLDYVSALEGDRLSAVFEKMHMSDWGTATRLSENFTLTKQQKEFKTIQAESLFNLIYFDAFGARVQPALWTETIFLKMYKALKPGGVLVTYAAKGSVRRAMQSVGFETERLPGPPGKREMLRARKVLRDL